MADVNAVNRRLLEISICALLREHGFSSASKIALETLTEMLQSYLGELGHSCKLSCELSARVKPTLSDVKVALIDMVCFADLQAFRQSSKEYQAVREKYAAQRKDIEEGLSKFLAKTAELSSGICEGLDAPTYPLLVNESSDLPYLSALGDFDDAELLELDETVAKETPSNSVLPTSSQNTESFDNPFLRPAKRARKTIKPS
ncbi:transcription initiation factor TFIID subunit 8-like [Stylophora pistillata]|uniref:transcription initiation factor TFIID subunit 8-like n=1 Tax=Stylophora pistillata TaxID=50429 RepID=UPI000C0549A2|nr:transcription initiation factor TFIID subunit 8-like [Stylophora pistillata]